MPQSVYGIVPNAAKANEVVHNLDVSGFNRSDISVLLPDRSGSRDFAHEAHTKAPEGAAVGATSIGVLGGAIGLLAGAGLLAIPGLGPFIAAGPIMATLSGAAVGAAVGGIGGALVGIGIPEIEAKRYEGKIKDGNVLISVHTTTSEQVTRARDVLTRAGASDIGVGGEKAVGAR
jgi:hypothetical protein